MDSNKTENTFQRIIKSGAVRMMVAVVLVAIIVGVVGVIRNPAEISFAPDSFEQTSPEIPQLSAGTPHGQIAVDYVYTLNSDFFGRFPLSYREMDTAAWLVEVLLAMGYTWDDISVQEFTVEDTLHLAYDVFGEEIGFLVDLLYLFCSSPFVNFEARESRQSQNVILTVPGQSNEVMVVGAHYDAFMYPGASDNASGVALLLESAQRMRELDNYYTIIYVFFGAEEAGLLGSIYYVNSLTQEQHDNILFMINADVLLEGPDLFYMAGYVRDNTRGENHITQTWDYIAQNVETQHGITITALPDGVLGPSDQLAFLLFEHTAMFLAGLDKNEYFYRYGMDAFSSMTRVLHSPRDCFYYINERWPGKIDDNMRGFSLLLEEFLLADYYY